jgi:hypothetical protein
VTKEVLFNNLSQCLEEEITEHRRLLELVRKEEEILIESDVNRLTDCNRAKETIINKIRNKESRRVELSHQLGAQLGLSQDNPTLLEMAACYSGKEGDRLRSIHSTLSLLIKRIKDLSRKNSSLIQNALTVVRGSLDALKGDLIDNPIYQKKGKIAKDPGAGQFVSREA